jgi:hypothetical protein
MTKREPVATFILGCTGLTAAVNEDGTHSIVAIVDLSAARKQW